MSEHLYESITRMLLFSDGSTTLLLESLLGAKLRLRVSCQQWRTGLLLAEQVRRELAAGPEERVLERQSELTLPDGHPVSRNYVAAALNRAPELTRPLLEAALPLGRLLAQHELPQRRRLLGSGRLYYAFDRERMACAYKHYIIELEQTPVLYIREIFHPDAVRPPIE